MNFRFYTCLVIIVFLGLYFQNAEAGDVSNSELSTPERLINTKPGNPKTGKLVFAHRKKGNCLACHAVEELQYELFHGEVGPALDDIGSQMSEGEIRQQVIDAQISNPGSIMPAYFRTEGLNRVLKKWKGKTILSAQELEDVVAYLMTLKEE